jgi:hypothetical protein
MELPGVISETFFKGVPTLQNAALVTQKNVEDKS